MVKRGCELLFRIGGESVFWVVGLCSVLEDPESSSGCELLRTEGKRLRASAPTRDASGCQVTVA